MGSMFQMVAGASNGMMQGIINNATNDANYTIAKANADASTLLSQDAADNNNAIREANNGFLAAQASLSNTMRSIQNQSKAAALGSQYNTFQENVARQQDSMLRGGLEQQIQAAATLGALRADAASRGVGGGAADIMRATAAQTIARGQNNLQTKTAQFNFDAQMRASGLRSNLAMSQDYGQTVAAINEQTSIPQTYLPPIKTPDMTYAQMATQGAATGAANLFAGVRFGGNSVGYNASGGMGDSGGYSSNSIINGVSGVSDSWGGSGGNWGGSFGGSGSNGDSWGAGTGANSDFSLSGSSQDFNFSLGDMGGDD